jgi:dihydroorotate dehydrogenase electron transfer subunit
MSHPSCEDIQVIRHRDLRNHYFSLLFGPYSRSADCRPGQFVHIHLPGSEIYFRRAFSVGGVTGDGAIEIILKVFGRGSARLAALREGDTVNFLGPLGVPFKSPAQSETVLMVAGGIGVPPLFFLAEELIKSGVAPGRIEFYYGGKSATDILERERCQNLDVKFIPTTEDGSFGRKGLVSAIVEERIRAGSDNGLRLYACGPEGMLRAINELGKQYNIPGQIAVEAPMPCGTGMCLGCIIRRADGDYARVCYDGPVFDIGEVLP